ncbi:uncharacterized protein VTP21DRAFT_159 [Calcarisporiella thermophila]|uniref:uncharacterized protein n=1 Tax=Calcarisporiella thermophila TaxID=911321 RepID=UPI00374337AC
MIHSWFHQFSHDHEFVNAILESISYVVRELEIRCRKIDWAQLILVEIPPIIRRHYQEYRVAEAKCDTSYGGQLSLDQLFHGAQPHFALQGNEENEIEYLRQLAEHLLYILMPERDVESDCVRHLVREILTKNVLMNLVEKLSDPDTVNILLCKLLDKHDVTAQALISQFIDKESDEESLSGDSKKGDVDKQNILQELECSQFDSNFPRIYASPNMLSLLQDAQESDINLSDLSTPLRENPSYLSTDSIKPHSKNTMDQLSRTSSKLPEAEKPTIYLDTSESLSSSRGSFTEDPGYTSSRQGLYTVNIHRRHLANRMIKDEQKNAPLTDEDNSSPMLFPIPIRPLKISFSLITVEALLLHLHNSLKNAVNFIFSSHDKLTELQRLAPPQHTGLDQQLLLLINEAFMLDRRHRWFWLQLEIFMFPVMRLLAGGLVDRVLAQFLQHILSVDRLTYYIQLLRESLWPNGVRAPPPVLPTEEERRLRQIEAELKLLVALPGPFKRLLGEDITEQLKAVHHALAPFQRNKFVNKHLIYLVLDLIISRIAPELARNN